MLITLGPARGVSVGTCHDVTWSQLAEWLRSHPRGLSPVAADYPALAAAGSATPEGQRLAAAKDGPWIAFATFQGNHRHLSAAPHGCAIPIDIDYSGLTPELIALTLHGYAYCAYTTFGHTAARPRWRVIVPTNGVVDAASHRSTWNALNTLFGGAADVAAKDISRLNYLPGPCVEPASAQFLEGYGALYPVVSAPPDAIAQAAPVAGDGPLAEGWCGPDDDEELLTAAMRIKTRLDERWNGVTLLECLWAGDAAALAARYPSREGQPWDFTRADMALANELSYFTGRDAERTLRIALQAGCVSARGEDAEEMERKLRYAVSRAVQRENVHQWPEPVAPTAAVEAGAREVPEALHMCTDQANAHRLLAAYGSQIISAAGRFYCWVGTHWEGGDTAALQFGCNLSRLVNDELAPLRAHLRSLMSGEAVAAHLAHPRKAKMPEDFEQAQAMVDALAKWAKDCEMRSTINNALGLLKTLLDVPMGTLDADPWLLNCRNGTIDLRTGALRAHSPADRITRCLPHAYDPAAAAPRFERFMLEVFGHDVETVSFLQRAFGYSATGSGREQCMLVHWGKGQNGKNTLHKAIRHVLGPYAQTAPPGLLTSAKEGSLIHEIADLYGARWVSVDESDDGARMREAAMKQMTGDDDVKGRHLYQSFFSYRPTFKLHLMTNHKPRIVGQDHGVWRRLILVPYGQVFSGAQRDASLDDKLAGEAQGVLSWLVRGALEWQAMGALKPSRAVLEASTEYRSEEDTLRQFLDECCVLNPEARIDLKMLYPVYTAWAKNSGAYCLGRSTFKKELLERPIGVRTSGINTKNRTELIGLKISGL